MKAILIINPSSGKMKRKMPPKVKWTLDKSGRRLAGLFKPKTTEDDVTKEVWWSEDKIGWWFIGLSFFELMYCKRVTAIIFDRIWIKVFQDSSSFILLAFTSSLSI